MSTSGGSPGGSPSASHHSRSETPPQRNDTHCKDGVDNPAFDSDEVKLPLNGTHDQKSNGTFLNTTMTSTITEPANGEEKKEDEMAEAVNLELINMKPFGNGVNGIPVKKGDSPDTDMGDPYDEYFVPVNEHRKYIRGEKLYVTKDKRHPPSKKKCLLLTLGFAALAGVLVIVALAALKNSTTNPGESTSRNLDGVKLGGILVGGSESTTEFPSSSITPEPATPPPFVAPTTEYPYYVKNALEGKVTITNLSFNPGMANHSSEEFTSIAKSLEDELKKALFDSQTLNYGSADIFVKVMELMPGSIVVRYRVGWTFKEGVRNPPDPITAISMKQRLQDHIRTHGGSIYNFQIPSHSIQAMRVSDSCQLDNAGCSDICLFDQDLLQFACGCPEDLVLGPDQRTCLPKGVGEDSSDKAIPEQEHELSAEPEPSAELDASSQPEPSPEPEASAQPEPSTEPEASTQPEPFVETEASAKPEPSVEPDASAKPEPSPEPPASAQPEPSAEPEASTKPEPSAEPEAFAQPEPPAEPDASVQPEPFFEPEASAKPEPSAEPEASAEPEPSAKPDPSVEPEVFAKPEPSAEPESSATSEPSAASEASVELKPSAEFESSTELSVELQSSAKSEPSVDPQLSGELAPTAEPVLSTERGSKLISLTSLTSSESETSMEPESLSEPKPSSEPELTSGSQPTSELTLHLEPETSSETEHSFESVSASESKSFEPEPPSEPHPSAQPQPPSEFSPSPEPGPSSDLEPSSEPQSSSEPQPSLKPEPTSELQANLELVPSSLPVPSSEQESFTEHTHFPEPQSTQKVQSIPELTLSYGSKSSEMGASSDLEPSSVSQPSSEAIPTLESKSNSEQTLPSELEISTEEKPSPEPQPNSELVTTSEPLSESEPILMLENIPQTHSSSEPNSIQLKEFDKQTSSHPGPSDGPKPNTDSKSSEIGVKKSEENLNIGENFSTSFQNETESKLKVVPESPSEESLITNNELASDVQGKDSMNVEEKSNESHNIISDLMSESEPSSEQLNEDKKSMPEMKYTGEEIKDSESSDSKIPESVNSDLDSAGMKENEHIENSQHSEIHEAKHSRLPVLETEDGTHEEEGRSHVGSGWPDIYSGLVPGFSEESDTEEPHNENEIDMASGNEKSDNSESSKNAQVAEFSDNKTIPHFSEIVSITSSSELTDNNNGTNEMIVLGSSTVKTNIPAKDKRKDINIKNSIDVESPTEQEYRQDQQNNLPSNLEESTNAPTSQEEVDPLEFSDDFNSGTPVVNISVSDIMKEKGNSEEDTYHRKQVVKINRYEAHEPTVIDTEHVTEIVEVDNNPPPLLPVVFVNDTHSHAMEQMPTLLNNDTMDVNKNITETPLSPVLTNDAITTVHPLFPVIKQAETEANTEKTVNEITLEEDMKKLEFFSNDAETTIKPLFVRISELDQSKKTDTLGNRFETKITSELETATVSSSGDVSGTLELVTSSNVYENRASTTENSTLLENLPENTQSPLFSSDTLTSNTSDETKDADITHEPVEKVGKSDTAIEEIIGDHKYTITVTIKPDSEKRGIVEDENNIEESTSQTSTKDPQIGILDSESHDARVEEALHLNSTSSDSHIGKLEKHTITVTIKPDSEKNGIVEDQNKIEESTSHTSTKDDRRFGILDSESYDAHVEEDLHLNSTSRDPHIGILEKREGAMERPTNEDVVKTNNDPRIGAYIDKTNETSVFVDNDVNTVQIKTGSDPRTIERENVSSMSNEADSTLTGIYAADSSTDNGYLESSLKTNSTNVGILIDNLDKTTVDEPKLDPDEIEQDTSKDINEINSQSNYSSYDHSHLLRNIDDGHDVSPEKELYSEKESYDKSEFKKREKKPTKLDDNDVSKSFYEKKMKLEKKAEKTFVASQGLENVSEVVIGQVMTSSTTTEETSPEGRHLEEQNLDHGNGIFGTDDKKNRKKFNKKSNGKLVDVEFDEYAGSNAAVEVTTNIANSENTETPVTDSPSVDNSSEILNKINFQMEKNVTVVESEDKLNQGEINDIKIVDNIPEKETLMTTTTEVPSKIQDEKQPTNKTSPGITFIGKTAANGFSKCSSGQFLCVNGTTREGSYCVPLSAKCDSINDCSDGSDEIGCVQEGCPGNFQCASGQCLKRHLVCNGIVDCNDRSDEHNCDTWECEFDELKCLSGRCIPLLWRCDSKPDCDNHTDEFNCQTSCANNEYLCPEGWCIPQTWRCNGEPNCANGEDEKLCDCSVDQFKCQTGGCVDASFKCDGIEHCPDNSDEWNCIQVDTTDLQIRAQDDNWLPVCASEWSPPWSDVACQGLGFAKAQFTESQAANTNVTRHFKLRPEARWDSGHRLTSAVALSEEPCPAFVQITCQEFTCGNPGPTEGVAARLVGGDSAANGQLPSVAILYHGRSKGSCTASIISPKWLLSSYNCLHTRDKTLMSEGWVAFGGGSMFDQNKPETQISEVSEMVPYPQVKFNRFLYSDDLVLVALKQPFSLTRYVGAICLPEKEIDPIHICVTAGWGYSSPGEINFSQYLHYLPVPTIDLGLCNSTEHYSGLISNHEICAGFTDAEKTPCYKDEGAPLMCVSEGGVWELHGVLSYHSHCGRGFHPSIFSSVIAVRSWIENTVGSRFERKSTFNVRR